MKHAGIRSVKFDRAHGGVFSDVLSDAGMALFGLNGHSFKALLGKPLLWTWPPELV
jgi:hypothetical protein